MNNLVNITNKIITSIEMLAEDYGAVPGSQDYMKHVRRIAKILNQPSKIVDMVVRKNIGEEWKTVKAHPSYKISNYGRVLGKSGMVLSSYIDCYGREIVDPQTTNGRHKHLHIRSAVIKAFIKPKRGERVEYLYGNRINTVHNLGIKQ